MKTLKGYTILYDEACPMCRAYTSAFVKSGMLDEQGRASYQQDNRLACHVDPSRAREEIALVHRESGEAFYGIDSMFTILGHSIPACKGLLQNSLFRFLISSLYRFISFNRRIIIPAKEASYTGPRLHRGYRLLYVLFSWLATSYILYRFSFLLQGIIPPSSFMREWLICGGQILWQMLLLRHLEKGKLLDYLSNMITVSLAGALALVPLLILAEFTMVSSVMAACFFTSVVTLMLVEHLRRTALLKLGWLPTIGWCLYRLFVVIILLFF